VPYQTVLGRHIKNRLDRVEVTESAETVRIVLTQTIRYGRNSNKW